MAYEMVMPYHLHMPSYFLETFTEYPDLNSYLGKRVCEDMVPLSFLEINSLVSGIGFRNTFN